MKKTVMVGMALAAGLAFGYELAFYDIVPYAPGEEARTAQDILAAHETAKLNTFLYSVSLDPRGYPAFDHVRTAMGSYRKIKEELAKRGGADRVKMGFLLQSILGHWPRVDKKIEPWQRSVNEDGEVERFCVLDERFRDYIRKVGAALAAERPCFILTDDDVSSFIPRKLECFCPLHTAEFNRRAGTHHTPEQYRAAVKACREGDATATICTQLRDELTMTVVKCVRAGIDSVDPKIPGGVCMPWVETLQMTPRSRVMAGEGNPVTMRLANGKYAEIDCWDLTKYVLRTQAYIDFYRPTVDRILDESDSFPHTLYARSGRSFGTKLALGVFCGIRGAKIWFVGMHKGDERVPESHDRALGSNHLLYETLAETLDGSAPLGLRWPAFLSPTPLRGKECDFCVPSDWTHSILGLYGVPFRPDFSREPGGPVLLGGAALADRLSDGELRAILKGRVLVDGEAALRLKARGFGAALGCDPVVREDIAFNFEKVRATGSFPPIRKSPDVPALADVAPTARVYSELRYSPTGFAADSQYVLPGAICHTNAEGGTVFTSSYGAGYVWTRQNLRRKAWLVGALRTLDPTFPVVCENPEPNLTQARRGRDGKTYAFTVNLSYDDIDALRYSTARPMAGAEVLERDGRWHAASARQGADGVWRIDRRLPYMDFLVVRW